MGIRLIDQYFLVLSILFLNFRLNDFFHNTYLFKLNKFYGIYSKYSRLDLLSSSNNININNTIKTYDNLLNNDQKSKARGTGQVYVCTNKWCREKGSDATMAAFTFLTPEATPVVGVNCLGRCNKGPNVRIFTPEGAFVEASMVRSVETVVELLQTHLLLQVNATSAEVLKLNYEGNVYLRSGDVNRAIECYDKAIELGDKEQEGVLLVMRGTALLQRAYANKLKYNDIKNIATDVIPTSEGISIVLNALSSLSPSLKAKASLELLTRVNSIFNNLELSPHWAEGKTKWAEIKDNIPVITTGSQLIDRGIFAYSLYEHALMRALQDLLTATLVLPGFAQGWRRAGDALSESRLYNSAVEYYEVALKLDSTLNEPLLPSIERLKIIERFVESAESKGWPIESVLSIIDDSI